MTLLRRILLYYALTLLCSLGLVGFWSWVEFGNQIERIRHGGIEAVAVENTPSHEALEIVFFAGLPAVLIGLVSGVILMRRALRPIQALTEALEKTDVSNLSDPVQRSGNGDELDRMTVVFNRMKARLDTSFTQAREFTLHSSHELKTPLTILHSTLEQMLTEDALTEAGKERVGAMLEEVQRLSGVVGQLSFLAKADAGQLAIQHTVIPLHELVADLADETAILASGRAITVTLVGCETVSIKGDRMRLRQLLLNLADNAVKHNQPHGSIEMFLRRDHQHAVFTIANTGTPLPPELCVRVFDRFFRGDPAHGTDVDGSGLGLCIARTITQLHNGTIQYEVLADSHTQVSVSLPCAD